MDSDSIKLKADELIKQADKCIEADDPQTAFNKYDEAARLYKQIGKHDKAATSFASAATCWQARSGLKNLFNLTSRLKCAAEEAMKYQDYKYAKQLYHEAARFYDQDGFPDMFSQCFYMSKICDGKFAKTIALKKTYKSVIGASSSFNFKSRFKYLFTWVLNIFFRLLWGYGEKPWRVLVVAFCTVILSSFVFYISGSLNYNGQNIAPTYFDALYFSIITFTTLGYGDYQPIGYFRLVSMIEASSSLFLLPLFIISLTRKYLRTYY